MPILSIRSHWLAGWGEGAILPGVLDLLAVADAGALLEAVRSDGGRVLVGTAGLAIALRASDSRESALAGVAGIVPPPQVSLLAQPVWTTQSGNKVVLATPFLGDLIVVVGGTTQMGALWSVSDDNPDGLGAYTTIDSAAVGMAGGNLRVAIRNARIGVAAETTFLATCAASTGGGLAVLRVSGMLRAGASAVKQVAKVQNQVSNTTPTVVLGAPILLADPVIGAIETGNDPAAVVPRAGYVEPVDVGFTAPQQGLGVMTRDGGETASTIAWGATTNAGYAAIVVELDPAV